MFRKEGVSGLWCGRNVVTTDQNRMLRGAEQRPRYKDIDVNCTKSQFHAQQTTVSSLHSTRIRSLFRQYWQPNIKHTIHKEIQ